MTAMRDTMKRARGAFVNVKRLALVVGSIGFIALLTVGCE
jgi:hypothetical protein